MNYFKCYSAKLAHHLINDCGFRMIGTEPNMKKPQFTVFLFERTPELQECLDNYFNN